MTDLIDQQLWKYSWYSYYFPKACSFPVYDLGFRNENLAKQILHLKLNKLDIGFFWFYDAYFIQHFFITEREWHKQARNPLEIAVFHETPKKSNLISKNKNVFLKRFLSIYQIVRGATITYLQKDRCIPKQKKIL